MCSSSNLKCVCKHFVHPPCVTLYRYGDTYAVHYPLQEWATGRSSDTHVHRSPLHALLSGEAQGGAGKKTAIYGNVYGWERPLWFAPTGNIFVSTTTIKRRGEKKSVADLG